MLKVGLIGLGSVAERIHLPAIATVTEISLVAACDPDTSRQNLMKTRFQIPQVYADAETLLAKERPDLVIIGTPPQLHKDLCLLALDKGAHVFCEKPFVNSLAQADEIIEKADKAARLVAVNNQYRYMNMYRIPQEQMARGDFGQPFLIQCWQQMFHPPYKEKNWRADLVQSTLFEFGTHAFDLLCFFFGAFPLSISVQTPRSRPDIAADVVVVGTLRFPNEAMATIVFNRISHATERYFEMRVDCHEASLRISLGGVAKASLDWSRVLGRPIVRYGLVKGGLAVLEKGGYSKVIASERQSAFASATAANLRGFVNKIQAGEKDNISVRQARELIRLVFAGYESAQKGEAIWL